MKINSTATVFPVSSLEAALRYFVEVLAFREEFRFGRYAGVVRDECHIHLSEQGNPHPGTPGSAAIYIFCDEVDAWFDDIASRGALVAEKPQNYEYGMRDFVVRDPDGNRLSFGAPTTSSIASDA